MCESRNDNWEKRKRVYPIELTLNLRRNFKMRVEIIRIGNSKGLRIPKAILEQCGMKKAVDLRVEDHTLIITPCEEGRAGWEKKFQLMAENKDDDLLDANFMEHSWDEDE